MKPSSLDRGSALSAETLFRFAQVGDEVWAEYQGGPILRGLLVGTLTGRRLEFRYVQISRDGKGDAGESLADLVPTGEGGWRLVERFTWQTRDGSGMNVFDSFEPHP